MRWRMRCHYEGRQVCIVRLLLPAIRKLNGVIRLQFIVQMRAENQSLTTLSKRRIRNLLAFVVRGSSDGHVCKLLMLFLMNTILVQQQDLLPSSYVRRPRRILARKRSPAIAMRDIIETRVKERQSHYETRRKQRPFCFRYLVGDEEAADLAKLFFHDYLKSKGK